VHQRLADGAFLTSHTLAPRTPDDTAWLVEIAGPALQELGRRVLWPAILSVPRLDHMETVDAVRTRHAGAYFDDYPISPIGFRSDLLRGASGRAYLAWCPDRERAAVLRRLGGHDPAARDTVAVSRLVDTTRARGYSIRDAGYGGAHTGTGLAHAAGTGDDGRNSIALPILLDGHVLGCVNLTWRRAAVTLEQIVERHLDDLRHSVQAISQRAEGHQGSVIARSSPDVRSSIVVTVDAGEKRLPPSPATTVDHAAADDDVDPVPPGPARSARRGEPSLRHQRS
jgi:IclR family mhp operon transcriptional activator